MKMAHAKIGRAEGAGKAPIRASEGGQDARTDAMTAERRSISRICAACKALGINGENKLADGRGLLEILSSKLPASAEPPALPKSRVAIVEKAVAEVGNLLDSTPEKLAEALGADANEKVYAALASLGVSLSRRIEAERYREWMGSRSPASYPPPALNDTPTALQEMGKGANGGTVIGHGV